MGEGVAQRGGGESVRGGRLERVRTRVDTAARVPPRYLRPALLLGAALLMVAAIFLPLWGMTLASIQYPEGLRMIVYPMRMAGDIGEINALNRYIGMAQISPESFGELRVIVGMFAATAVLCAGAAVVRRKWIAAAPLALMAGAALFGFLRMRARLYQYGHDLDPTAPIEIAPFTPPMLGDNQIAQFGTYSYFSWGTILPIIAAVLLTAALWLDVRGMPTLRRR